MLSDQEQYEKYSSLAASGKLWCYDCVNYYTSYFCGYDECRCKIYGSIDCGQTERHPDTSADTCPNYKQKYADRWFEKYKPSVRKDSGMDEVERLWKIWNKYKETAEQHEFFQIFMVDEMLEPKYKDLHENPSTEHEEIFCRGMRNIVFKTFGIREEDYSGI